MDRFKLLGQYAHLHFIVVLLGFTAILGALITMDAITLVWYRMFFATLGLMVYLYIRKISFRVNSRQLVHLFSIGVLVALHWITFFHAIKVSNVSVTLGVFASVTLFTSFLEPILQKRKIFWLEVVVGLVIIGGIYLIFQYEMHFIEGILFALLSAFLNGLFVVLNRNISHRWHPVVISFYELWGGFMAITLFYFFTAGITLEKLSPGTMDLIWILILSIICTSYAFTAIVELTKTLSAYTIMLAINLEPVYGIFLAFLIFGQTEAMSGGFYLGTSVIIIAVFSYPFLKRKFTPRLTLPPPG